jgi:molecular chaperone DnaK (HSP70)
MTDGQKVLVCDLGGGTFDATVLTLEAGVFKPVATMGDRHLGGHDWTMQLVDLVAERCCELFQDDPRDDLAGRQVLYENCEKAKRSFLQLPTQSIVCRCAGKIQQVTVQRQEFEARTEHLIQRMVTRCQESMDKASLSWVQIDTILMVGGSSRLRRMAESLEGLSGKKPVLSSSPDLAVACGAAIMAKGSVRAHRPTSGLTDANPVVLTDVAWTGTIPRSLGTRAYDRDSKRITNALIIPRDVEIPISKSNDDFEISRDGQEFFNIPIVEFEDDVNYDMIRNYRFRCPADVRRGERVRVTFHYDRSGILTADARHLASDRPLTGEEAPYEEPSLSEIEICVKPRWVVFALDASGSMYGDKIENAKQALLDQSRNLLAVGGGTCKVGVVQFSTRAGLVCEPTDDLELLSRHIARIGADGSTAMDQGINMAVDLVEKAPAGTDRDVVLLTDGYPNKRDDTLRAADRARNEGIVLSALSIGQADVDVAYLQSLTPLTLQIKSAQEIGTGVGILLTKASSYRSKLTDGSA